MQEPIIFKKQDMLKIGIVARRLAVSRQTVYNMIEEGKLRAFRFGFSKSLFVHVDELKKLEIGVEHLV